DEAPPKRGCEYAAIALPQPAPAPRLGQRPGDGVAIEAAAGLEILQAEAFLQPQHVEHVLERPLPGLNALLAADAGVGSGHRQPRGGVPGLPAAHDRLLRAQGQLAVGAGADAQVVAVAPVVE